MPQVDFLGTATDYLRYLPELHGEFKEFREIADTVDTELDLLKQKAAEVLNEQYINDSVKTLKNREREFSILSNASETVDFRRARLIERKSRRPPITVRSLVNRINEFIGTDESEVVLIPGEYAFEVRLPAVDAFHFAEIQQLINQFKPANMEYIQNPFSFDSIRIEETSTELKISYARAGLAIAGPTPVAKVISTKIVYQR